MISMGPAKKLFQVVLIIRVTIKKGKSTDSENTSGKMDLAMKVIGNKTKSMEKDLINGLMDELIEEIG